ncbi:hypothetical protein COT75_01930 [Candidatus Beckwithbacteria bacterium CG10_big_fil_rev_8_21_14_0_10_34_10]|uniref:dTDP-4-dehydrorhamnose reductase n=1 Tax=Candidatus Beckwithbacteria bacterium CG10_big_fil_rev_8_21_14_0_10_34_10 TaxID=1974495 RepID=A0A2H0WBW0_9BACT|nr:MAG: hypothetical protein COT75_01930 [Candidatus Beckwithbacteria bacterium CG10_big_fil_rev_8_21_14_0_10_34_10]
MRKKIIATGINGLVGSRIVELLQGKFEFINFGLEAGIDITNYSLLEKKFGQFKEADLILHLAAFTDVNEAFKQTEDKTSSCYKVNVEGSKNIAQLAKKHSLYMINISTDFVFDGQRPPKGGYTEKSLPHPIEWYGQTKRWAEEEINKIYGNLINLRIAFPFKAKYSRINLEPKPKLDLVRRIIESLRENNELFMFTDQIITPTFIDDITAVILRLITLKPKGIFHCVGSSSLTPYNLGLKICDIFELDKNNIKKYSLEKYLEENPGTRLRQKNLSLSNKKIEKELGVKMSTINEALEKMKSQMF